MGKREALPDLLSSVAAYCPVDAYPARLPLAFIAAYPSARLVAELREAQRVVYFQFAPTRGTSTGAHVREHGEAATLLATATTPLSRLQELFVPHTSATERGDGTKGCSGLVATAMRICSHVQLADVYNSYQEDGEDSDDQDSGDSDGQEAARKAPPRRIRHKRAPTKSQLACCGTSVGGVITALVSRRDLRAKANDAARAAVRRQHGRPTQRERPVTANHDIASKTTLREWLRKEEEKQQGEAGAMQTGLSTHLLDVLESHDDPFLFPSTTVAPTTLSLPEAVTFHEAAISVDDHRHRMKTAMSTMAASALLSARDGGDGEDVLYRALFVSDQVTASPLSEVVAGVSRWWLQRAIRKSELPSALRVPQGKYAVSAPLHVKLISDVFASSSLSAWLTGFALWDMVLKAVYWVYGMFRLLLLGFALGSRNKRATGRGKSWESSLKEIGCVAKAFSPSSSSSAASAAGVKHQVILQALDVSRTSFTGAHLLTLARKSALDKRFLLSLDLMGCSRLSVSNPSASRVEATEDAFAFDELCGASDAGLALGKLSYLGGLTWLNVAGASFNQAAVDSLGSYSLLREALALAPSLSPAPRCSLLAVNMTSCATVASLASLAFVPSLVQLLAPFCDVNDSSLHSFDGSNYLVKLAGIVAGLRNRTNSGSGDTATSAEVEFLAQLAATKPPSAHSTAGDSATAPTAARAREAVSELARRFSSHVYHLDLTFSVGLCDINAVLHTQRVLQFLNVSQTRIFGVGLGADVRPAQHTDSRDTSYVCPLHRLTSLHSPNASSGCYSSVGGGPTGHKQPFSSPLRVLVCDPADYVDTLQGLTPSLFPSLEKLYLRSGSLSEEGIAAAFDASGGAETAAADAAAAPFPRLKLLDLSYCDKLHDVGILSRFPAVHTLSLDNTEVTPHGLRHLTSPHGTLKVLSLRHCPDVMDVLRPASSAAERLELFRQRICNLSSLKAVIVETE